MELTHLGPQHVSGSRFFSTVAAWRVVSQMPLQRFPQSTQSFPEILDPVAGDPRGEHCSMRGDNQWIGLRENLQETMVFTIKYRGFL